MAKTLKSSRAPTSSTSSAASIGDPERPLQWAIRFGFALGIISVLFGVLALVQYVPSHSHYVQYHQAFLEYQDYLRQHPEKSLKLQHDAEDASKLELLYGIGFIATGALQIVFSILLGKHMPMAVMAMLGVGALNGILAIIVVAQALMERKFVLFGLFLIWVLVVGYLMYLLKQSMAILADDSGYSVPGSNRGAPPKKASSQLPPSRR